MQAGRIPRHSTISRPPPETEEAGKEDEEKDEEEEEEEEDVELVVAVDANEIVDEELDAIDESFPTDAISRKRTTHLRCGFEDFCLPVSADAHASTPRGDRVSEAAAAAADDDVATEAAGAVATEAADAADDVASDASDAVFE